jgi:MFS family permease
VLELRVREPLVRLTLLVGPRSLSANLASMLGFAMFAAFTLFTNLVQTPRAQLGYGLSGSVLDVGLYLLPATVGMLIFSALAGRFERRLGAAYTLALGSLFVALSLVWLVVRTATCTTLLRPAPCRESVSGSATRRWAHSPCSTSPWTPPRSPAA